MKTTELRIGNTIILCEDQTDINIDDLYKFSGIFDFAKPIPLTNGWLNAFGFKPTDDYFMKKSIGKNLTLEVCLLKKRIIIFHNKNHFYVELKYYKYVHELQNLYFALTGKELTNS